MTDWKLAAACLAAVGLGPALSAPVLAQQPGKPPLEASPQVPGPGRLAAQPAPPQARPLLKDVVQAIAQEHGFRVMDPWGVLEAAESRSPYLKGQPAEAALWALLVDYEVIFYYPAAGAQGVVRLDEVWVYPPGMLDRKVLGARSPQALTELGSEDPLRRAAAIEEAVFRDALAAMDIVLQGLRDSDERVRAKTLFAATSMGVPVPREQLIEIMRSDPAEEVRAAAVDALVMVSGGEPESLRELIGYAERDPSPVVQAKAAELSAMLASTEAPPPDAPVDVEQVIEPPPEPPAGSPLQPPASVFSPPLR